MRSKNSRLYDAVLVLGGNITKTDSGKYAPSTYQDSDGFGMLGGYMRIITATWMYIRGEADTFVFSTGTSEKTKAKFGTDVPTEAYLYSQVFKEMLAERRSVTPELFDIPEPTIILEEYSQNTVGNVRECFEIIRGHGWATVAVLSADFHIPRVQALCNLISQKHPVDCNLVFTGAETKIKQLMPGTYDQEINMAYASPEGQKRMECEARGLQHIQSGSYVMGEYQLHRSK